MQQLPRTGLTHSQLTRLREWLEARFRGHARDEALAAMLMVVVALIANALALAFVFFIDMYFYLTFAGRRAALPGWLWVIAVATMGAMYPLYIWRFRATAVRVHLTHGVLAVSRRKLTLPETGPFDAASPVNFGVLRHEILLFPVWAVASFFAHAFNIRRCLHPDGWAMARVLGHLYRENRRIMIHDLDMALNEPGLAEAIRTLEMQPGLLFFTETELALALTDELAGEIAEAAGVA